MMNRMGHCVNYHTVEELETELTFEARQRNQYTPFGMTLQSDLGTGVEWDNFDRFVETESGKDTLHDTVGKAYQSIPHEDRSRHNEKVNYSDIVSNVRNSIEDATEVT